MIWNHYNHIYVEYVGYNGFPIVHKWCRIVWHFCGKENNGKIEKNPRMWPADIYDDYESEYMKRLNKFPCCNFDSIIQCSRSFNQKQALCVSKICLKSRNLTPCEIPLNVYKQNETQELLAIDRSFIYYGIKLWHDYPVDLKDVTDWDLLRDRLWQWHGQNIDDVINCNAYFYFSYLLDVSLLILEVFIWYSNNSFMLGEGVCVSRDSVYTYKPTSYVHSLPRMPARMHYFYWHCRSLHNVGQ